MEQACSGPGGSGSALFLLLAVSNGYGCGDLCADDPCGVFGHWAGDWTAVVGDCAEPDDLVPEHEAELVYDLGGTGAGVESSGAPRRLHEEERLGGVCRRAARIERSVPYADITPPCAPLWRGRASPSTARGD